MTQPIELTEAEKQALEGEAESLYNIHPGDECDFKVLNEIVELMLEKRLVDPTRAARFIDAAAENKVSSTLFLHPKTDESFVALIRSAGFQMTWTPSANPDGTEYVDGRIADVLHIHIFQPPEESDRGDLPTDRPTPYVEALLAEAHSTAP